jgi:hypothetical protein
VVYVRTRPDPILILESLKTYPQTVICTPHNSEAQIVIANWPFSEEGWSDWRVIDGSLLPGGAVQCGMDCLSQARAAEKKSQ